jgi:hypothetical protein
MAAVAEIEQIEDVADVELPEEQGKVETQGKNKVKYIKERS